MGSINDTEMCCSAYTPGDKVVYISYGDKLKTGTIISVGSRVKIRDNITNRVQSVSFNKVAGPF